MKTTFKIKVQKDTFAVKGRTKPASFSFALAEIGRSARHGQFLPPDNPPAG
jgi:hypothetical protein